MKRYYWPLVVIGATLLILGAALPWASYCGGWVMVDQPYCTYTAGWAGAGLLPAVGGVSLLLIALISNGKPDSAGLALLVSVLCLLVIVGGACTQTGPLAPIISDAPTYSPAFGFLVSLLGAGLCISGSTIRVSGNPSPGRTGLVLLAAVELFIVCMGVALLTHPLLGDWLGFWHTSLPRNPCGLTAQHVSQQQLDCYATATAKAIQLIPPWGP